MKAKKIPSTTSAAVPATGEAQPGNVLEELIAAQGIGETATYERLLGTGRDLWADDAEFERFMERVQMIRREKD